MNIKKFENYSKSLTPCKMVSIRFEIDGKEFGFYVFISTDNLPEFISLYKDGKPVPSKFPIINPSVTIDSYGKGVKKTRTYDRFGDLLRDKVGYDDPPNVIIEELRVFGHLYSYDSKEDIFID